MGRPPLPVAPRMAARSERQPNGCLLWTGGLSSQGYGQISINNKNCLAHRVAYEMAHGPFDDTLFVCHHCDTPRCIESSHLFLGTNKDNMTDCKVKERIARGTRQGSAKLTEDDVRAIRKLNALGVSFVEIGRRFDISGRMASYIAYRKKWAWLA